MNANEHAWSACWSWILVACHIRYKDKRKNTKKTWTIFILILLSFNLLLLMCLKTLLYYVLYIFAWVCSVAGDLWMWRCSSCAMYLQKMMCALCMFNIFIIANQYCFVMSSNRLRLSKFHFAMMVTSQHLSCNFLGTLVFFSHCLMSFGVSHFSDIYQQSSSAQIKQVAIE